jgi:hypothetical protein
MFLSCDAADCADKYPPALALPSESFLTLRCQTVVTPPSLIGLFDPAPVNQAAILEPVKQRWRRKGNPYLNSQHDESTNHDAESAATG